MSWKTAVVIPILLPGKNLALAESYRPISLLPVLSKLAEKVILARLNDHLERENILIPEQHGFRARLSTSHQLLRVVEFIKEGNNKDECTAAVFLNIQKAFDDTAILSRHRNLDTLVENINEHLAHLETWFSVWKIALNSSKMEAVFFFKRKPPPEITLQIKEYPGLNTPSILVSSVIKTSLSDNTY
ncbi:putative RNA-directed DNA polymerase from transposon X-element [Trichonephila clavipes]|nr:putative RNA-directed DNA polymerase from transposon X-element [Trichonephila clavipes]